MPYLIRVLDNEGQFELIDEAWLSLYPDLNTDSLIPLSDAAYQQFCEQDNGTGRFIDGKFVFTQPDETTAFKQHQAQLIAQLTTKTDQLKTQVLAGYSQAEIESFYRQEREAREWLADHNAPTPMLSQIVESRPEVPSLAVLVEKVVEKANQFSAVMGAIIGKKQAVETRIELAKTVDDLTACEQEIAQWQLPNL